MRGRQIALCLLLCIATILSSCQSEADSIAAGDRFLSEKKYEDAELQFRKALQQNPNSSVAHQRLGKSLHELGKDRDSLASYLRATEIDPNNLTAQSEKADLLLQIFLTSSRRPKALYDNLKEIVQRLSSKNPQSFDVLRIEGSLALADGNFPEAVKLLRAALEKSPDHELTALSLIECLYADKQVAEAEHAARTWIQKHPKSIGAYDRLYGILINGQRQQAALELLLEKEKAFPQDPHTVVQVARHYFNVARDNTKGMQQLSRLTDPGSTYKDGALAAASYFMEIRQPRQAADILQSAVARGGPRTLDMRKLLAECYQRDGRWDAARQELTIASKTAPEDDSILVALAIVNLAQGKQEGAEAALKILDTLKAKESKDPRLDFHRGRALFLLGKSNEAVQAMQDAIRSQRGNVDARFALVAHALSRADSSEALRWLDQIDSISPDNPRATSYRLQALRVAKRFDEAFNLAQQAKSAFPDYEDIQLELGLLRLAAGRGREAQQTFQELYNKGFRNAYVIVGLMQSYLQNGQGVAAKAMLDKEIAANPNSSELQAYRADLLRQLGDTDGAIAAYEKLSDPNQPKVASLVNLGELYGQKGNYEKAYANFSKAVSLAGDPSLAFTGWINTASRQRNGNEVQAACKAWLGKQPTSWIALNNCAFALAETNQNLEQAEAYALQASRAQPTQANLRDTLGFIYLQRKKFSEAQAIYRRLCQEQPANPTFRYHAALASVGLGLKLEARRDLQEALRNKPSARLEGQIRNALATL